MDAAMHDADIGLIGLAVMGENLVLNMEGHGFRVAVFNRTLSKIDEFLAGRAARKNIIGARSVVVGYECDGCDFTMRDGLPYPTGADGSPTDLQILALAPAKPFDRENALRHFGSAFATDLELNCGLSVGGVGRFRVYVLML